MGASILAARHLCLALALPMELLSQVSEEDLDGSRGTMWVHFVFLSKCQLSHKDAKCRARPENHKV